MKNLIWSGASLDPSGYGEATRGYLRGLSGAAGDKLNIKLKSKSFWSGSSIGTSADWELLNKLHANDFDRDDPYIYVQHLTPDQWAIGYGKKVHHVGVTTFETDQLPYGWKMPMRGMDELWTFSEWSKQVFIEQGMNRPVYVMPHGVDTERFRPDVSPLKCLERWTDVGEYGPIGPNTYVFGSNFDWTERKNPRALLKAYFTTFRPDEDVVLALKVYYQYPVERSRAYIRGYIDEVRNSLQLNKTPKILLVSDIMPSELVPSFYAGLDAYVLPTRGEGWGLTYSEAMATGLPTIGTGWSGNTEFMNDNNSILLQDYKLVEITAADAGAQRQYIGHKWADVDVEELRGAMRWCFEYPTEARAMGRTAREDMVSRYSWSKVGQRMLDRVMEIA